MTDIPSAEAIQEKKNLIAAALKALQSGGDENYLRELLALLQRNLSSLLVTFERNPGLDAATTDLFAAASAVVNDMHAAVQPLARKRRLMREAQDRFDERVILARPNGRKPSATWCKDEIFLAA
jgi:hypothetical protein